LSWLIIELWVIVLSPDETFVPSSEVPLVKASSEVSAVLLAQAVKIMLATIIAAIYLNFFIANLHTTLKPYNISTFEFS
jgi:hypothetical protein